MQVIEQSKPWVTESDIEAVVHLLRSGHLEMGTVVEELEKELSLWFGKPFTIATANGFSAIHLALLASEVGPGDEVIIPSYTCPAVLYPVKLTGATPVFADIGKGAFNMSDSTIDNVKSSRTKAIIWPHMFGFPAAISRRNDNITTIEDVAQAFGGTLGGKKLGSLGEIAVTSLYATKNITASEGGSVSTNSEKLAANIRALRYYGGRDLADNRQYYNYKLHNLNAALALSQLARASEIVTRRRRLASVYHRYFSTLTDISVEFVNHEESCYHRYPVLFPDQASRELMKKKMGERGIKCGYGVLQPLHHIPDAGTVTALKNTEDFAERILCLPLYPSLNENDIEFVIHNFEELHRSIL